MKPVEGPLKDCTAAALACSPNVRGCAGPLGFALNALDPNAGPPGFALNALDPNESPGLLKLCVAGLLA